MADLHNNVGRFLSAATRHMAAYLSRRTEPLGFGAGHCSYLFSLYRQDGQSQQQLADCLLVDKSAAAHAISRLETLGYVRRQVDTVDRRQYRVHLTESGRAIRPQLEAIVDEVQDLLLEGLDDAERALLLQTLKRATERFSHKA